MTIYSKFTVIYHFVSHVDLGKIISDTTDVKCRDKFLLT